MCRRGIESKAGRAWLVFCSRAPPKLARKLLLSAKDLSRQAMSRRGLKIRRIISGPKEVKGE